MNLNIRVGEILDYNTGDYTCEYTVMEVLPNLIAVKEEFNPIWWVSEKDIKKYFHKKAPHKQCFCWDN